MKAADVTSEQLAQLLDASQPILVALLAKTALLLRNETPEDEITRSLMEDFLVITIPEEGENMEIHYFSLAFLLALQMHVMGKSYLREGSRSVKGL